MDPKLVRDSTPSSEPGGRPRPKPYSRAWFRIVIDRATTLLVEEDPRLAGIAFGIVQADPELGIVLEKIGVMDSHQFLPRSPKAFWPHIRESVIEHSFEGWDFPIDDPKWPPLAYHGDMTAGGSDEESDEDSGVRSGEPPVIRIRSPRGEVSTRVSTSAEAAGRRRLVAFLAEEEEIDAVCAEMATEDDAVDHPPHYNTGEIEVIDAIEAWGFGEGFNRGNVIKYLARAGKKSDADELEDLEKAAWYLTREIERVRK